MKKKRSSRFSASVLLPMVIALCLGLTACGASAAGGKNEAETVMETAAAAGDTQGETVTEGGDEKREEQPIEDASTPDIQRELWCRKIGVCLILGCICMACVQTGKHLRKNKGGRKRETESNETDFY